MANGAPEAEGDHMMKRLVAGPLWFIAVWGVVEITGSFVGLPRAIGPLAGVIAAAFVLLDPFGLFWVRKDVATREPASQEPVRASTVL
jgi:hypothetical protein